MGKNKVLWDISWMGKRTRYIHILSTWKPEAPEKEQQTVPPRSSEAQVAYHSRGWRYTFASRFFPANVIYVEL